MNGIRAALLTAIAMGCLTLGCAKKSVSDQTLTTDIQAKLYADPATKAANLNVAVSKGAVTLSGDVPSSDVEVAAVKIANGTTGVSSVNDQIKVNPSLAANQPPNSTNPAPQPAAPTPGPAQSSQPAPAPQAAAPPPNPNPAPIASAPPAERRHERPAVVTIPAGERVSVRMIDAIDSGRNEPGQVFRASLYAPLVVGRRVIVPAGTPVSVLLTGARDAGRIKGRSELEVRLSRLEYQGHAYPISSTIYGEQGNARGKQTAVRTGVGAAAGAIIGAIAGGGKGAAIGSAAGGGAGLGYNVFTHGQQVKIPSETVLSFRLEAPLTIDERR